MNKYMSSLREREGASKKRPVRRTHSASRLVYGVESQRIKTADTPIILPVNKIVEQEDIVNNKIPLLISRPTMTELGFIIDAKIEEIKVDGTNYVLKLGTTVSGHFKIPICRMIKQDCHVTLNTER